MISFPHKYIPCIYFRHFYGYKYIVFHQDICRRLSNFHHLVQHYFYLNQIIETDNLEFNNEKYDRFWSSSIFPRNLYLPLDCSEDDPCSPERPYCCVGGSLSNSDFPDPNLHMLLIIWILSSSRIWKLFWSNKTDPVYNSLCLQYEFTKEYNINNNDGYNNNDANDNKYRYRLLPSWHELFVIWWMLFHI